MSGALLRPILHRHVATLRIAAIGAVLVATGCDDDSTMTDGGSRHASSPPSSSSTTPRGVAVAQQPSSRLHEADSNRRVPPTTVPPPPTLPPAPSVPPSPPASPLAVPTDFPPPPGPVDIVARPPSTLGTSAFSVNARVQPHGQRVRWWVEYGTTTAYGAQTMPEVLGPRLAAHYAESWDSGLGGWAGGMDGAGLTHRSVGGASSGYVHFATPSGDDSNHEDGIGYLQLTQYLYNGSFTETGIVNAYLGGGDTDMRDARIALEVRGSGWVPNGSELVFWAQSDSDLTNQLTNDWRRANWAFTGFSLTDALMAGGWQHVEYVLANDTSLWSYAGHSVAQERPNYAYWPLDKSLAHLNCDLFHNLVLHDLASTPSGAIDYDELHITYRNHSLLLPSNGGRLVSVPTGSTGGDRLTDGWRHGSGTTWQSAANPVGPQEIVFSFVRPVVIGKIQIHQDPEHPSKGIEVFASADGLVWRPIADGVLPASSPDGPNFVQLHRPVSDEPAQHLKIRVLSGYQPDVWGLGEVEAFGSGALMNTDDDWYNLNTDVTGLVAGTTYHYRVATSDGVRVFYGADQTATTPSSPKPVLETGPSSRIATRNAKLEGRVTSMGLPTEYWFELGRTTAYGLTTSPMYAGVQPTPRTVIELVDGLSPGTTYHYRLVAANSAGMTYGSDRTFATK